MRSHEILTEREIGRYLWKISFATAALHNSARLYNKPEGPLDDVNEEEVNIDYGTPPAAIVQDNVTRNNLVDYFQIYCNF